MICIKADRQEFTRTSLLLLGLMGGLKVMECKEYGSLRGGKWDKMHEISRRVYCSDGISPTIHTCGGEHRNKGGTYE